MEQEIKYPSIWSKYYKNYCNCGKQISPLAKLCNSCSGKIKILNHKQNCGCSKCKNQRGEGGYNFTKEFLEKEYFLVKTIKELAKKLNCSEPTIIKYFKKFKILKKKQIPWNKGKTKKDCPSLKGNTQKGRISWNTGLTKETDIRLQSVSEKSKNHKHTEESKNKIKLNSLANWQNVDYILKNSFPYEERVCICGCNNKFIVKINSKQKFIHGHNFILNGYKFKKGHISWSKGLTMETDSRVRNMILKARKAVCQRPTSYEKTFIDTIIKNNLPYKYVGNGEVWIGNANPDFINTNGEKKVIEVFHDYYKILQYGSVKNYKRIRKDHYRKYGFTCLFLGTKDINKLQKEKKWKDVREI